MCCLGIVGILSVFSGATHLPGLGLPVVSKSFSRIALNIYSGAALNSLRSDMVLLATWELEKRKQLPHRNTAALNLAV